MNSVDIRRRMFNACRVRVDWRFMSCLYTVALIFSGAAMGWPGRAKSRETPSSTRKFKKNNSPVTVKIRTSGYQTLECFIATLPTGRLVRVGETCNRFADSGL